MLVKQRIGLHNSDKPLNLVTSDSCCRAAYAGHLCLQHQTVGVLQDMHLLAERHILRGLKEGGWLKGEVDDMLEQRVAALFMPHGE